ncbi:MAG: diguanylate cyclase [Acidihalobacter sp.]
MHRSSIKQNRIILIARLILIAITALVGATVFFVMKNNAQRQLIHALQATLENHVGHAETEIKRSAARTAAFAARPFLTDQIAILDTHPDAPQALKALQRETHSLLDTGYSAIALYGKEGHRLVISGSLVRKPVQQIPLQFGRTELLYSDGYYLRTTARIMHAGKPIGKVVTESSLPMLSSMFAGDTHWGKTAELAMCASAPNGGMRCFPSSQAGHALKMAPRPPGSAPRPMSFALQGETGAVLTRDHRQHNVVAVFMPVSDLGLGMVLKIDRSELYAPVWRQLMYLLPLLLLLLGAALLSLRWLLNPLVTELVRSEQETQEANERLRDSEQRIRMLVDSVDEGIVSIAVDGTIELFNPGAERMFGYRSEEVLGRNVSLLMPEPHRNRHDDYLHRYLETGEAHVIGNPREVTARRKDDTLFPMELRVSQLDLEGQRKFIGIVYDISERKANEEKIAHLAQHDALTGLPNRRLTQDRVEQAIARAQRSQTRFAVMFVDLDRFKHVNDAYGHDAGDQLLKEVAQRLTACLRGEDTIGRQGGDEFIVLLSDLSDDSDAVAVAGKIRDALSEPFQLQGEQIRIDASLGIAVYPRDGTDFETLIKHSDTAMYHAKKSADGRYRFFAEDAGSSTDA